MLTASSCLVRASIAVALFATLGFVACDGGKTSTGSNDSTGSRGACLACGAPRAAGVMANPAIVEASGLVASAVHDGVFYVHNDSGDSARFFAVGAMGEDLGTFDVSGASAIDWEDIALGPCSDPQKSCVYLGDIGDNGVKRSSVTIYRVIEPDTLAAGNHTVSAESFTFTYDDGPHNAETLLVHPKTGVVTIVTKAGGGSATYELPMPLTTSGMVARHVADVPIDETLPLVTGGDVSHDGTGVLLRTYEALYYFTLADGASVAAALGAKPCSVPVATEKQGEAVAWLRSGKGWVTTSEGVDQALHVVDCQ